MFPLSKLIFLNQIIFYSWMEPKYIFIKILVTVRKYLMYCNWFASFQETILYYPLFNFRDIFLTKDREVFLPFIIVIRKKIFYLFLTSMQKLSVDEALSSSLF